MDKIQVHLLTTYANVFFAILFFNLFDTSKHNLTFFDCDLMLENHDSLFI